MSKIVRNEKNLYNEKTRHFKLYIDLPENSLEMTPSEMFNMMKLGLINLSNIRIKVMNNKGFKEKKINIE